MRGVSPLKVMNIREQIDGDANAVNAIIASATAELRSIYCPIKTKVESETGQLINIVALIEENIVGYAEYLICENNALIRGLAVSPNHRRQGVAKTIIEYIVLVAQKEGKNNLMVNTIKETGNHNIFSRMGFEIVSEEKSEIFQGAQGDRVTLVSMVKTVENAI